MRNQVRVRCQETARIGMERKRTEFNKPKVYLSPLVSLFPSSLSSPQSCLPDSFLSSCILPLYISRRPSYRSPANASNDFARSYPPGTNYYHLLPPTSAQRHRPPEEGSYNQRHFIPHMAAVVQKNERRAGRQPPLTVCVLVGELAAQC